MDYLKFLDELDTYNEWNSQEDEAAFSFLSEEQTIKVEGAQSNTGFYPKYPVHSPIGLGFYTKDIYYNCTEEAASTQTDCYDSDVDHPSHYTSGGQEVIDTIEDVIIDAPDPVLGGLQWNILKYVMRLWLKDNPKKDAMKARWYLDRLISKL